jgi:hypothetical protein
VSATRCGHVPTESTETKRKDNDVNKPEVTEPEFDAYHRVSAAAESVSDDPQGYPTTVALIWNVLLVCGVTPTPSMMARVSRIAGEAGE